MVNRNLFGEGEAGNRAFFLISAGSKCEGAKNCGAATTTVDFDVLGELEMVPTCEGHRAVIEKRVLEDLTRQGRLVSFGVNGRGRA